MATIYANLIVKGRKSIEDVPEHLREDVRRILAERGWKGETAV